MARRRWARTRVRLEAWLLSAHHAGRLPAELVLLGGSAGWMMSSSFLVQFRQVLLVDIDPWARRLFLINHGAALRRAGTQLEFWRGDAHALLEEALARHAQACVLFDNFLGLDSMYTRSLELTAQRLRGLRRRLAGRLWGSVHDRLSGPGTADWPHAACWREEWQGQSAAPLPRDALLRAVQAQGEWIDHGTEPVLPAGHATHLIPWPIVAGRWHWLEAGWVDDRAPAARR